MSQGKPTIDEANTYASEVILNGGVRYKAFKKAFPGSVAKNETLRVNASKFHRLPLVQKQIKALEKKNSNDSAKKFSADSAALKERLVEAVNLGLKLKKDSHGNMVAHNIAGAVSAIREINLMDGNHAAIKTESYGPNGGDLPTPVVIGTTDPATAAKIYMDLIQADS